MRVSIIARKSKYRKSLDSSISVACNEDPIEISAAFRDSYKPCNIYNNSAADSNAFDEFSSIYNIMFISSAAMSTIDVDLLEKDINQLKYSHHTILFIISITLFCT